MAGQPTPPASMKVAGEGNGVGALAGQGCCCCCSCLVIVPLKHNWTEPYWPYPPCCRQPATCPKNHIQHLHNTATNTNSTLVHLEHWKNDKRRGGLDFKVPTGAMVEVFEMMEAAAAYLGAGARGLVFSSKHYQQKGVEVYQDAYFSQKMQTWLTPPNRPSVWFNQVRSMWITAFSDYVAQATLTPEDGAAQLLREAAAALVGNSVDAWDRSYDSRAQGRAQERVNAHYSTFRTFVREQHAQRLATVPRNPINGQLG